MTDKPNKLFTVQVDNELLKTFKAVCSDNDRPASQVIRDFMREYIAKNRQGQLKI